MPGDELRAMIGQLVHDAIGAELRAAIGTPACPTVDEYEATWEEGRIQLRLVTVDDDHARYRDWIKPLLGRLHLVEVRPPLVRQLVRGLVTAGKLAARTIRNINGVGHRLFEDAVADGWITINPWVLKRGDLPKIADKDPAWRLTAQFEAPEVVRILNSARIPAPRRILDALKVLAGLRHTEAATLKWNDIQPREPLDCINLPKTKARIPRQVPVHPELRRILDDWREQWAVYYGRPRWDADLICPTRRFTVRKSPEAQRQFLADLERVGLRRRRGHDLRRTFVTLLRSAGARDEILKCITHGARQDMLSLYTTFPWETLCAEVEKLRLHLSPLPPVEQLDLPYCAATPAGFEATSQRATEPDPTQPVAAPNRKGR